MRGKVEAELDDAIQFAKKSPFPEEQLLLENIYAV
jgi:TPP-dependent pyruvate/acetoin dehydrogenase alpha subunit